MFEHKKHKIICIGDSITFGAYASNESNNYPGQLANMLNDPVKYEVINLGIPGRKMMKNVNLSYWDEDFYQQALASEANTIFIMLGTNDAWEWSDEDTFVNKYETSSAAGPGSWDQSMASRIARRRLTGRQPKSPTQTGAMMIA